jgi:hypothetical protein
MPRLGFRRDGKQALHHVNKPILMQGASWVEPQGAVVLFEDFLVDVLADSPLTTVIQSGTPTTAGVITVAGGGTVSAGAGGWVGGSVQNVDAEIDELSFGGLSTASAGAIFRPECAGNGVMVMEMGFVIPTALTARQYYVGWADDPTDGTTTNGALNIQTAYTLVAVNDNAAGFVFSSLATAPTIWKYAAANATAGSTVSAATEGVTAIVDCYTVCRVEIDSAGNAYFWQTMSDSTALGRVQPSRAIGALASAVVATAPLLPMFSAAPTTTTAVTWEVDYCFAAEARA